MNIGQIVRHELRKGSLDEAEYSIVIQYDWIRQRQTGLSE